MYSAGVDCWELCIIVTVVTEIHMHLYIDTPLFEDCLLKFGLVHISVFKFILWLDASSHRSFSLPCRLICCWLRSHLHSQSQTCPQGTVTSTLPVYSWVIKNLACINIPISVLSVVLQTTHRQPEKHPMEVV